ncbi:MAG: hypothetical protein H6710_17015 [Myxococcales bacterium]|nr:hypothetical protein [Myxococcales bacterium]
MMVTRRWLRSPAFDLGFFVAPGLVAALAALALWAASPTPREVGPGLWIVAVLLVDVAHVYASLYRTYLDPVARRIHRRRLIAAPLLCAWVGLLLHLESPLLFWGVMAYVAIFHFIKQHLGFALLYVRAAGEGPLDRKLVIAAIWAGTLAPVVRWHAELPRNFSWFVDGDMITGAPAWLGDLALALEAPILAGFVLRRLALALRGRGHGPMIPLLVLTPALTWHLGIVWLNDDRVFTLTNVLLHGIPYLALVWLAGGRAWVRARLPTAGPLALFAAFYGLLVALGVGEEWLWDRLVWHDHPQLFGGGEDLDLHPLAAALVTALLAVPQATHYLLDRWIWRVGPENPALAGQLGLAPAPAGREAAREDDMSQ